jgi:hypothetical protein
MGFKGSEVQILSPRPVLIYNIQISGQDFIQNTAKYAGILADPDF